MINRILNLAARVTVAVTPFLASDIIDWLKRLIVWAFDKSCDPDKFGPLTNIF